MKKPVLFLAGMLFIGLSSTFAQADTTSSPNSTRQAQTEQGRQKDNSQNYTKDMVKIQQSDIPDNLKQTLQGSQYKGWESGTLYRTKSGDGYLIEMKDGSNTRVHRFDANGRPQGQ